MDKRLTLSDYIITLVMIFLIVCIVAAFFYGLKVGRESALEQYADIINPPAAEQPELEAYHQQYLVSFYHTVYLPFIDYQKKWFEHMNSFELRSQTTHTSSVLKDLEKLASEKYKQLEKSAVPASSPLLVDAHRNYLKSIKLFQDAAKRFDAKDKQGTELITALQEDPYVQEAQSFALQAQNQYYHSIFKWHQSVEDLGMDEDILNKPSVTLTQWQALKLNTKNSIISKNMSESRTFKPYLPQDIAIRIDEMIALGQAARMNISTVEEMIDMLVSTGAVRSGDYDQSKERFYKDEVLPQLPFFFE